MPSCVSIFFQLLLEMLLQYPVFGPESVWHCISLEKKKKVMFSAVQSLNLQFRGERMVYFTS